MFGRTVGGELYSSLVRVVWGECIWIKGARTKRYSMDRLMLDEDRKDMCGSHSGGFILILQVFS